MQVVRYDRRGSGGQPAFALGERELENPIGTSEKSAPDSVQRSCVAWHQLEF